MADIDIDFDAYTKKILKEGMEDGSETANRIKAAADKGDINSMYKYARMLQKGKFVKINLKEAFHYHKMAADKGNDRSMAKVAEMYSLGNGCEIDHNQAVNYAKKAVEKDNAEGMYLLGYW